MHCQDIISNCLKGVDNGFENAHKRMMELFENGYSPLDVINTIFRVVKNFDEGVMLEFIRLEFIKEIGFVHMRLLNGVNTMIQLSGLVARLCQVADKAIQSPP